MGSRILASVFEESSAAERVVRELQEIGVPGDRISIVQSGTEHRNMSSGPFESHIMSGKLSIGSHRKVGRTVKGMFSGGALGRVASLGALVIPALGPFVAGGAIAQILSPAGSALAVSESAGATAGGLAGALIDYGIERTNAEYFERRIRHGDIFVSVDTNGRSDLHTAILSILRAAGGRTAMQHERERASG